MQVVFNPKFVSEYNSNETLVANRQKSKVNFQGRSVSFDKRNPMQVSYQSRLERENLRVYNG